MAVKFNPGVFMYMQPLVIKRSGDPHAGDKAPQMSICIVRRPNKKNVLWEQMSPDSENPYWKCMGEMIDID